MSDDNWIKCSERLPEPKKREIVHLLFVDAGTTHYGYFDNEISPRFYSAMWGVGTEMSCVTDWQPLPNPPKE